MVDFQSRDTRRGPSDEAEGEGGADDGDSTADVTDTDEGPSKDAEASVGDEDAATGVGPPAGMTYAVVSVSAERTVDDDPPGDAVVAAIEDAGANVVSREMVDSGYDPVQSAVDTLTKRSDVRAVVTLGGTGVQPADVTVEAVDPLLEKRLPGFGELVRLLCHEERGSAIVRTRATAGIADGTPVFCLPGEEPVARLGATDVVVPEAETLADQAGEPQSSEESD